MAKKKQKLTAEQKWGCISEEHQQIIVNNTFCDKCGRTTIVDYVLKEVMSDIVLQGKCGKCGRVVARLVEFD